MTTKCCNKCKTIKAITDFNQNKSRKDGYHSICRDCMKSYLQNHYNNNKTYYRDKTRKAERRSKHIIDAIKANTPCCDCGNYYDPICIDFDHTEPIKKAFGISGASKVLGYSIIKILLEIEKCDIVCANCHRLRTKQRGGWD